MADDDPFACFDQEEEATSTQRSDDCGVLAFHHGTEQSLLVHVQNGLREHQQQRNTSPSLVLELIDTFCMERHWMMHVGPEKGNVLKMFLSECLTMKSRPDPFTLLELGTYCGYSSILWAKLLQEQSVEHFHVVSIEISPENAAIASRLIQLAGLQDYISILLLNPTQTVVDVIQGKIGKIDLLFLDHDKSAYLPDLVRLEQAGFIRSGTHVAADNVIFAGIVSYRDYIQCLVAKGVVESRLVEGSIEYSGPDEDKVLDKTAFQDGIELTVYKEHPFVSVRERQPV